MSVKRDTEIVLKEKSFWSQVVLLNANKNKCLFIHWYDSNLLFINIAPLNNRILSQRQHWISVDVYKHFCTGCRTTNCVEGTHAVFITSIKDPLCLLVASLTKSTNGIRSGQLSPYSSYEASVTHNIKESYKSSQQEKEGLNVRRELLRSQYMSFFRF